ncbi:hypothetical protein ACFYPN_33325 [Streptomyces sp. NPDC005576]|uniref:hypothetical protein n=1 Tax=unclassified Streptomyces TaxID=2593676 RepID=UPI00340A7074
MWEPVAPPTGSGPGLSTPADALAELLATLVRRQREHRSHTVARLTTVIDTGLLPGDLHDMALYYRAKSLRDTGHARESRADYQHVAAGTSRLVPGARRGLAHAARLTGDFPTAHTLAQTLGWEGRHHRVLGDLYWLQGQPRRAAESYLAGRTEAEQHAKAGEAAHNQALYAFTVAFYDTDQATTEIDLAHQLLTGLNLRATTINARRAALIRDAGTHNVDTDITTLRNEIENAGLTSLKPAIELAAAFHQAVLDDHTALAATLDRLRETTSQEHTYFVDIAHFMAGLPLTTPTTAQWLDGPETTRHRWRTLVTDRRHRLTGSR